MATAQLLLKLREKIASLPRGLIEKLLSMADCLIYESRLLIEDALEDSSLFLPAHLVEVLGLYLRKPQQFLESRHLILKNFSRNTHKNALGGFSQKR